MNKGAQTKRMILDRGMALASVVGLSGVTIGTLASELSLSKSGLYGHFKSKENLQMEILQAAIDRFVERVVAPGLKAPRGEPRVLALLEHWRAWDESAAMPGGCLFVDAAVELDDQPGPLRDLLVQSQRDWLDALATAARIAVEEGHFRADLDTTQFAYEMWAVAHSYHFISRLLRDPSAELRAKTSMERLLRDARAAC